MVYDKSIQSSISRRSGKISRAMASALLPSAMRRLMTDRTSRTYISIARGLSIIPSESVAMAITSFLPRGGENLRRCAAFNVAQAAVCRKYEEGATGKGSMAYGM